MNTPTSRPLPRPSFPLRTAALALLAALSTAACNSAPKAEAKTSATLLKEIQAEIGDAACDGPQHCRSIAIGNKACGGPEGYLAWSTQRNSEDGSKLKALTAAHAAARTEENRASGMASNCAMVMDPGASCQAGRCQLQPRGFGSPPGRAD